jgi:hypothetical protein
MPPGSKTQQASSQQSPAKKSKRTEQMTQADLRDFIPADIQE